MNRRPCIILALLASLVLLNAPAQAQDESHVFVVQTWEAVMPDGGTAAERDSLLSLYYAEVIAKNDLIVSERNLRHLFGGDSRDWIVITEYRSWNDIDAANDRNTELFRQKWATPEERRAFNRSLGMYFEGHSDEIYSDLSRFSK